jgi:hypothetical protein
MTKTINHSNLKGIVRFWHKYRRNEQSRPDVEFPYYICKGENGGFTLHQIKKKSSLVVKFLSHDPQIPLSVLVK